MRRVVRHDNDDKRERETPSSRSSARWFSLPCCTIAHTSASRSGCRRYGCTSVVLLLLSARRRRCVVATLSRDARWDGTERVHDATCRSHACSENARNGFVDSYTRSARHRMCATCARLCVPCVISDDAQGRPTTLAFSRSLARACSLSGRATTRAERGRRGLALLRERPTVARTPSYLVRYYRVSCRRHESTSVRSVRRGERVRRSVRRLCLGCLERQRRTVESRARTSAAGASSLWVRKRPSARRGPGIVSVDRNVRSKCRCSCVLQFTR